MVEVPAQVADQLYAVPPRRFVAERDAAVARARTAGDTEIARAIAGLRRPAVAAWLVNLLALRRPELVAELAELAEALQAAQRERHGGTLRDLTAQRRSVVSALVRSAGALAREVDPEAGGTLPLAEVESTLTAALADPRVAAQVRAARLQRPVSYTGFGEALGAEAPPAAERPGGRAGGAAAERERARAAELAQAREAAGDAEAELRRATDRRQELAGELKAIDEQLAELNARRAGLAARLAEADGAERQARRAAERAGRRARGLGAGPAVT